jgi:hypothetical protein
VECHPKGTITYIGQSEGTKLRFSPAPVLEKLRTFLQCSDGLHIENKCPTVQSGESNKTFEHEELLSWNLSSSPPHSDWEKTELAGLYICAEHEMWHNGQMA